MDKLIWILVAGAAGTLARYSRATTLQPVFGTGFQYTTMAVNTLGCFLAGLIAVLIEQRIPIDPQNRAVIFIGFLGAFTTFSSVIHEIGMLADKAKWLKALGFLVVHNVVGVSSFMLGLASVRFF